MYDEYAEHTQIKPAIVAKIPMRYDRFGAQYLDEFIELSPGLNWLKEKDSLIITIQARSITFYTDCKECLEEFKNRWTENVAVIPLSIFTESIDTRKDEMVQEQEIEEDNKRSFPTSLSKLRQKLYEVDIIEESDAPTRAKDILNLIRRRRRKEK